jgi:hypothetical protein
MLDYKLIKDEEDEEEVESINIYQRLARINHDIRDIKKGLKCAKRIKRVQFKYRVFKRKKLNYTDISNRLLNKYAIATVNTYSSNLKKAKKAICDKEIYAYEVALLNDETREYEPNSELDTCIDIYKSDIKALRKERIKVLRELVKNEIDDINNPDSRCKNRVLRKFLR